MISFPKYDEMLKKKRRIISISYHHHHVASSVPPYGSSTLLLYNSTYSFCKEYGKHRRQKRYRVEE